MLLYCYTECCHKSLVQILTDWIHTHLSIVTLYIQLNIKLYYSFNERPSLLYDEFSFILSILTVIGSRNDFTFDILFDLRHYHFSYTFVHHVYDDEVRGESRGFPELRETGVFSRWTNNIIQIILLFLFIYIYIYKVCTWYTIWRSNQET